MWESITSRQVERSSLVRDSPEGLSLYGFTVVLTEVDMITHSERDITKQEKSTVIQKLSPVSLEIGAQHGQAAMPLL